LEVIMCAIIIALVITAGIACMFSFMLGKMEGREQARREHRASFTYNSSLHQTIPPPTTAPNSDDPQQRT
jgi:hypothetical protein